MERKAVILLSGGLDSTTTLVIASNEGFIPFAMTFRYGLRHEFEIDAAQRIAQLYGAADHIIAYIALRSFGGSALTSDMAVPKNRLSEGQ